MDERKTTLLSTVSLSLTGVLFVALGVPLALGRVAPNSTYGVRTARTALSEELWYAINAPSGVALAIAGGVTVVGCVVLHRMYSTTQANRVLVGNFGVFLVASVIALVAMVWINQAA